MTTSNTTRRVKIDYDNDEEEENIKFLSKRGILVEDTKKHARNSPVCCGISNSMLSDYVGLS